MAYNIAVDVPQLGDLSSQLASYKERLSGHINSIYSEINAMQDNWQGKSYITFNNECYSYAGALQALVALVDAYKAIVDGEVTPNGETYITECENAFNGF